MKKIKILSILSFLAILSPVSALEPNYWGRDVKTPLEVYFRDCTSNSNCPNSLGIANGTGNLNDTIVNISTSFNTMFVNYGVQTIFKPEQSLVKDMLYNLSIYSCTSNSTNTSATLSLLSLQTGATINEVMSHSNSINIVSSSSSVVSNRPFLTYNLSDATASATNFDSCSMYNVLFVPSKNSTYIGAHNKSSSTNTTNLTFVGYNIENLGQYNQLSADQIQNIVSNNNEVIKQQIDQMNNDISSSLDDLKDQQEKNNQELIDQNKENWKDNMQNCRDSKNLLVISDKNYCNSSNCLNFKGGVGTPNFTNISSTFVIRVNLASPLTLSPGTYTINVFTGENYPYFNLYNSSNELIAAASNGDFGRKTFTLTSTTTISYLSFYYGSPKLTYGEIKPILYVGSDSISFEPPGEICTNKIDDVKDSLTNDDIGDSDNKLGDFLTGYEDNDTTGLSGIVSAPLRVIKAFSTAQCKPFEVTLYKEFKATIPCVQSMLSENTKKSAQFKLFQSLETGFVAYCCVKSLYNMVQKIKNPDDDRVEVLDL